MSDRRPRHWRELTREQQRIGLEFLRRPLKQLRQRYPHCLECDEMSATAPRILRLMISALRNPSVSGRLDV